MSNLEEFCLKFKYYKNYKSFYFVLLFKKDEGGAIYGHSRIKKQI